MTPKKPTKPRARKSRVIAPQAPTAAISKAIAAVDPVVTVAQEPPPPAPPPEPAPTDAELAFLALYAEDAFTAARRRPGADLANPGADPRLFPRWSVIGTLTAVDAPLRIGRHKIGARKVFYGWHLKGPSGRRVLAIRGTQSMAEWGIDGLFCPRRAHPVAGRVHDGFWDLFASMRINDKPLVSVIGGAPITVVGHSLGAALATLVSFELTKAAERDKAAGRPAATVRGVFIASPHPGDADFCKAFGAAVPDHVMYRNAKDIVPRVPFWFDYHDVPKTVTLDAEKAGIDIIGGWGGQHHVLSYIAMMDRKALDSFLPFSIDKPFLNCIRR